VKSVKPEKNGFAAIVTGTREFSIKAINNDSMSLCWMRGDKQQITKVRSNDFAVVRVFQTDLFRQTFFALYGITPHLLFKRAFLYA